MGQGSSITPHAAHEYRVMAETTDSNPRGPLRDWAETTWNLLDLNGTDSPLVIPQEFFALAYWTLIAPRFADEIAALGQSVLFTPLVQFTSDYAPFLILVACGDGLAISSFRGSSSLD
jgi:hypothetical protein